MAGCVRVLEASLFGQSLLATQFGQYWSFMHKRRSQTNSRFARRGCVVAWIDSHAPRTAHLARVPSARIGRLCVAFEIGSIP